jgi:ribosomal protein S18 acetylase RimI-like enzyme
MLDKNIAFKNIIMRIDEELVRNIEEPALPSGYSFRFFEGAQDIEHWAAIETSVLEFASVSEAADYFTSAYLPYEEDLKNRCLFVCDNTGQHVATATAWYADSELGHQAVLHWVAVRPECQGLGLGKAVVLKALQVFDKLEPGCDVWLHTQTWSHVAVRLYRRIGFSMTKQDRLANLNTKNGIPKIYPNDFKEAIEILETVMGRAAVLELINTAV